MTVNLDILFLEFPQSRVEEAAMQLGRHRTNVYLFDVDNFRNDENVKTHKTLPST